MVVGADMFWAAFFFRPFLPCGAMVRSTDVDVCDCGTFDQFFFLPFAAIRVGLLLGFFCTSTTVR